MDEEKCHFKWVSQNLTLTDVTLLKKRIQENLRMSSLYIGVMKGICREQLQRPVRDSPIGRCTVHPVDQRERRKDYVKEVDRWCRREREPRRRSD